MFKLNYMYTKYTYVCFFRIRDVVVKNWPLASPLLQENATHGDDGLQCSCCLEWLHNCEQICPWQVRKTHSSSTGLHRKAIQSNESFQMTSNQ
jgi:hypothetical protein